jgi:hypothetical protein
MTKDAKERKNIKNWDRMVSMLKDKFILKYYQINLFKKL